MTTAQCCAPELLDDIFAHLIEPFPSFGHPDCPTSVSADLRSAALVCRTWREPAQAVLFRHVVVPTNGADRFATSEARGRHPTRSMWVDCWSLDWRDDEAELPTFEPFLYQLESCRFLSAGGWETATCEGLQELSCGLPEAYAQSDWGFLRSSALANLRVLSLVSPFGYQEPDDPHTPFPFRLTSLSLLLEGSGSPDMLNLLSFQSSVTHLRLRVIGRASMEHVSRLLRALAPSLRHLHLELARINSVDLSGMINLEHLTLGVASPTMGADGSTSEVMMNDKCLAAALTSLPPAPTRLRHLSLACWTAPPELDLLLKLPALAVLASLRLVYLDQTELDEMGGTWLEEYERRGVRVIVAGE